VVDEKKRMKAVLGETSRMVKKCAN